MDNLHSFTASYIQAPPSLTALAECFPNFVQPILVDPHIAYPLQDGSSLKYSYRKVGRGNQYKWHFSQKTELLEAFGSEKLRKALSTKAYLDHHPLKEGETKEQRKNKKWGNAKRIGKLKVSIVKEELPTVGLWNSGTDHYVIAADFDHTGDFEDFWAMKEHLETYCKVRHVVAVTHSGHLKAFFPVKCVAAMNPLIAIAFLKEVLPFELFEIVDKKRGALSLAFLNEDTQKALSEIRWLPVTVVNNEFLFNDEDYSHVVEESSPSRSALVFNFNTNNNSINKGGFLFCNNLVGDSKAEHKFLISEDCPKKHLPELQFWANKGKCGEDKSTLLKILLKMKGLILNQGFNLPVHKLAEEVGTTPMNISRWLKYLTEKGYLKCIDPSFQIGVKAKTYIAIGELREAIQRLNKPSKTTKLKDLPSSIPDGQWESVLWKTHFQFQLDENAFKDWAYALPGCAENRRLKKIERIADWMIYLREHPDAKCRPDEGMRMAA